MPSRKDKDEELEEFKVVDRRLFTSEGELRHELPPEPPQPPPPKPPQPAESGSGSRATPPSPDSADQGISDEPQEAASPKGQPGGQGPVQFEHLIMSLVSSAMYHLGVAARPGEVARPPDLPAARETIDLLALLQQKTKGNLTPEEEQLLSGSLQELRLVFVEINRQSGRIR